MPAYVLIHADHTPCGHDGLPALGALTCPAGYDITHIRTAGETVPAASALATVKALAGTLSGVLSPLVAGWTTWAATVPGAPPEIRALATFTEAISSPRRA